VVACVILTVERHGGEDGETVSQVIGFGSQLDTQPAIAKSAGAQGECTSTKGGPGAASPSPGLSFERPVYLGLTKIWSRAISCG
jgi:hypothetical protein